MLTHNFYPDEVICKLYGISNLLCVYLIQSATLMMDGIPFPFSIITVGLNLDSPALCMDCCTIPSNGPVILMIVLYTPYEPEFQIQRTSRRIHHANTQDII